MYCSACAGKKWMERIEKNMEQDWNRSQDYSGEDLRESENLLIPDDPDSPEDEDLVRGGKTENWADAYSQSAPFPEEPAKDLLLRFSDMTDEEVVLLCHEGDNLAEEYLLDKYKNFVRSRARSYFLIGADHEDIVQEGMIGLYKAIRDFRPEKLSSFRAFAELCVTRQIITAIKTATRQKHIPLNSYISLNKPLYDEESDRTLMDVIMEGRVSNPEEIIINREDLVNINDKIKEVLSGLEQEVLNAYLDGKSYQEIAESLGRHVKSIDNALQRVKRKLEKYLEETEM